MPTPKIGRFLATVVKMYFEDHPPPHFQVRYGDDRAIVAIDTLEILAGTLPPRSLSLIVERAALRRNELRDSWTPLANGGKVVPIGPH